MQARARSLSDRARSLDCRPVRIRIALALPASAGMTSPRRRCSYSRLARTIPRSSRPPALMRLRRRNAAARSRRSTSAPDAVFGSLAGNGLARTETGQPPNEARDELRDELEDHAQAPVLVWRE